MKPLRFIHALVGVVAIALLCLVVLNIYLSVRNQQEASRIDAVYEALEAKLSEYHRTKGEYPSSLSALTFNLPQEAQMLPAIQKINYVRTPLGYELSSQKKKMTFESEPLADK